MTKKITTTILRSRLNRNSPFHPLEPNQIILGERGPSVGPSSLALDQRFSRAVSSCIFTGSIFIYRACHLFSHVRTSVRSTPYVYSVLCTIHNYYYPLYDIHQATIIYTNNQNNKPIPRGIISSLRTYPVNRRHYPFG